MPEERERGSLIQHPRCPYCKDAVRPDDEKVACHGCMAWQHSDCWTSHGACSACGAERGDQEVSASRQASPQAGSAAPVCAVRDCGRLARPTRGALERDKVLLEGERLHVDRFCPLHADEGLSRKSRGNIVSSVLLTLLGLATPVIGYFVSQDDPFTSVEEGLCFGLVVGALIGGVGLWGFAEGARIRGLIAGKDPSWREPGS